MLPEKRIPTHPGQIVREDFLRPRGHTAASLARHLGLPLRRVKDIVADRRSISPELAWLFSFAFGTTPELWSNAQSAYDLARSRPRRSLKRLGAEG